MGALGCLTGSRSMQLHATTMSAYRREHAVALRSQQQQQQQQQQPSSQQQQRRQERVRAWQAPLAAAVLIASLAHAAASHVSAPRQPGDVQ